VSAADRAWTSRALDGQVYGEPLMFAGHVYAATENDTVYSLSAATGAVAWSAHLGSPVTAGALPCGNITPRVGITGTPVIDALRREIFVVADELAGGRPAHELIGLSTASGRRELTRDVDPPGADTAALLQRTGLTLDRGHVVFGFGGNYGDCAAYRGRVVSVPETGGAPRFFTVDAASGESQGAIWMGGGAPAIGRGASIWVSAGNGSVYSPAHAYDHSDSVLELSPSLRLLQFFAPANWPANNSQDLDMSTEPVLLPDGQVILAGKSRIVYLLDGRHLGGIGHQQATLPAACSDDIDGGFAVAGMTVYLPCVSGIIAVRATASPAALHLRWSSGTGGGPPIIAGGLVWTIGQNGVLYGLDPATGKIRQRAFAGQSANDFPTPAAAGGLLLAPAADRIVAFTAARPGASGAAPVTPTASSPATARPAHPAGQGESGSSGVSAGAIAGLAAASLAVLAGAGWLLRRRRASH
jgi:outer membrane protein assembly factor BamB